MHKAEDNVVEYLDECSQSHRCLDYKIARVIFGKCFGIVKTRHVMSGELDLSTSLQLQLTMSRLLPGLALFARPCRPAARLLLPRAPTPTPTRTLSSLSTLPPLPRPPNSTPTIPRTLPTQLPRPSLLSQLNLSQIRLSHRTRPLSTSAQNAMRPTYFRDRPPAGQPRRPQQSWWQRFRARFDSLPPNYVVYALIGVNVAVFLMWQYAINSWVSVSQPSPPPSTSISLQPPPPSY